MSEVKANALAVCPMCEGTCTVPVRKADADGNWLEERHSNHEHGSEWCPMCKGTGVAPAPHKPTIETAEPSSR